MPPQLLVSVRSHQEAEIAAKAAVPIIDFKEPNAGSLGMLNANEIHLGVNKIRSLDKSLMCSAAMGEVTDWLTGDFEEALELPQLDYLKLGLSGLADDTFWKEKWLAVRSKIENMLPSIDMKKFGWIAVAYVDAEIANSPSIPQIIEAARDSFCRGVLFDTFEKNDRRFSDWVSDNELQRYVEQIDKAGMGCAVAGRLRFEDVERLAQSSVDIIAVRSAVCVKGDRTATINEEKVRSLQGVIAVRSTESESSIYKQLLNSTRKKLTIYGLFLWIPVFFVFIYPFQLPLIVGAAYGEWKFRRSVLKWCRRNYPNVDRRDIQALIATLHRCKKSKIRPSTVLESINGGLKRYVEQKSVHSAIDLIEYYKNQVYKISDNSRKWSEEEIDTAITEYLRVSFIYELLEDAKIPILDNDSFRGETIDDLIQYVTKEN